MELLKVENVSKAFGGILAINRVSFDLNQGEVLGLIGPNGAGKSTTIKTMLDFMKPDSGEIKIFGEKLSETHKERLGYLPEERGLYKKLPAFDLILYLASLKGMDRKSAAKKADELLDRTGMLSSRNKKIKEMSKGMGQLIQLIVTIIHDPDLIILDEPFSGLDPVNIDLLKRIIGDLRDQGKAIILSAHQMNEVEELCDRILMINKGSSVLYGDLKEIKTRYKGHSVIVDIKDELGDITGVLRKKIKKDFIELTLDDNTTPQQILEGLIRQKKTISRFEIATPSLTEIFLKIVGENNE